MCYFNTVLFSQTTPYIECIKPRNSLLLIRKIPSLYFRDNSVHLHECSPFWVGIVIIFEQNTTIFTIWCIHTHSDCQSTEACLCYRSLILCWHRHILILLSLKFKENTVSNVLLLVHIKIKYLPTREQTLINLKFRK